MIFTEEDRAQGADVRELATAAREGCADDKRWHLRRDGSRAFLNGSVHPLPDDAGGQSRGFINIARNETERRRSEQMLRQTEAAAKVETHGLGARGSNLYDGTLRAAHFQSIVTHGDGAIGVQLSKPFETIAIDGDVRTAGGEGDSLVRGEFMRLRANAFDKGTAIIEGSQRDLAGHSNLKQNWLLLRAALTT